MHRRPISTMKLLFSSTVSDRMRVSCLRVVSHYFDGRGSYSYFSWSALWKLSISSSIVFSLDLNVASVASSYLASCLFFISYSIEMWELYSVVRRLG